MRIRIALLGLLASLLTTGLLLSDTPAANANCREFPQSVTPECVAQNLAEEQARQNAYERQRLQDLIDAENRAKEQAARDYAANGSRPCSVYPASITPECAAENLAFEKSKQAAADEQLIADLEKANEAAKAQAELEYIRNGSRPCTLYPASITPACVTENLEYETKRQVAALAQSKAEQLAAEKRALKQAKDDYIRNGSRPCSIYPASITAECAAENLKFEEIKKIEIAALTAARLESDKSLITTTDDNGSLLVVSDIPKGVNLLNTKVRLVNSKGKLVDAGEIRYDSSGRAYFVFDKQVGKGNYKIELSIPKKKAATIAVKL
jgi:uncharacterized protein YaiI (UPF0178 family)